MINVFFFYFFFKIKLNKTIRECCKNVIYWLIIVKSFFESLHKSLNIEFRLIFSDNNLCLLHLECFCDLCVDNFPIRYNLSLYWVDKQNHSLYFLVIEEDVTTLEHEKLAEKQKEKNLILAESRIEYLWEVMRNYNVIIESLKDHSLHFYEILD